ncbi:MAG: hypothetical protein M3Q36_01535 [bacterium]|nr:hypothetical protein [bacterium]
MYAGLVLTKYSGRLMGAHQKIDRVSRRHLTELLPTSHNFPQIKDILKFEGKNGPDGIKRKSPGRDEPWHYLTPLSDDNHDFMAIIDEHYKALVKYLKSNNIERAAFEAAWLAHAVVDGLTPAHHFPYEEKIAELRGGKTKETRTTVSEKLLFKGDTFSKTILNTARAYGPKGVMLAHFLFESGFTFIVRPLRLPDARPKEPDFAEIQAKGYGDYFIHRAREIAVLDMYDNYLKSGWTAKLSNQVRHILAPTMVKTVTMLWYAAALEADK